MRHLSRFLTLVLLTSPLALAQKPALVQNVDEKGRVPFQQTYSAGCQQAFTSCAAYIPVPAGQRLVVTYLNAQLSTSGATGVAQFAVSSGQELPVPAAGSAGSILLNLPTTLTSPSGSSVYTVDRELTMYADGVNGTQLGFSFEVEKAFPNVAG